MFKLIPFELGKIWLKKSFPALILLLLVLNTFLLWYLNKPSAAEPPLSAYKAVYLDLSKRSPKEQAEYLKGLTETLDSLKIVEQIVALRSQPSEQSRQHAAQMLETHRDIFEKYEAVYESGSYLIYTDSMLKEITLINEIASEYETVSEYDKYIRSIEENKNRLNGVSIFVKKDTESFSSRNIEKSYNDHKDLTSENIGFTPYKGVKMASENTITDLFLLLSIMLFTGGLITEEKEKGLLRVTRATKNGVGKCMSAKLAALLIHSFVTVLLLYGSNFIYAAATTGVGDLSASIHSVAAFRESALDITLGEYFTFGLITKTAVIFTFGAAVTAVSVISSKSFVPQLAAVGWLGANWLAFQFIPAYSIFNPIKYLSFWGIINPKFIYAEYLNFNVSEYPINRTLGTVALIAALFAAVTAAAVLLFVKGSSLDIRKTRRASLIPFHIHANLLVHEGSKILFTNKAIVVLAIFALLIGCGDLEREHALSIGETYYQTIMKTLEGELTDEKERYILEEKARYDEAFAQIAAINEMIVSGEIDSNTGSGMRSQWEAVTALYPYFQRAEQQYKHIIEQHGGVFIYDTGYRYLFGKFNDNFTIDLLLLSMCMIFAFGNALPMEDSVRSWNLLSATVRGKRRIISGKMITCAVCAAVMTVLPFVFRLISMFRTFPTALWGSAANDLPMYYESGFSLPIWMFAAAAVILQIMSVCIVTAMILLISANRKSFLQTVFLGLLIFAVPLTLSIMGLEPAKWFSVYPLYAFTKLI
ncbi:MAG: hypothetical protein K2J80_09440 [Oscillospiraceae bacterium]|nr:hypothetical protein [Oscillospiraceae bacterium]